MWSGLSLELGFRLRQALPWSPRPRSTPTVSLDALRTALTPDAARRFDSLGRQRDLEPLTHSRDVAAGLEALWCLDTLERVLGRERLPTGAALDVGAKNATHLPGQLAFAPRAWDLVELDAHRRYPDLTTRGAHGRAMAARFQHLNTPPRYLSVDVRAVHGRYSLITWLLPFVVEWPHQAWGLPPRLFAPQETLAHVLSLLQNGGALVVVNQGQAEAAVQRRLLAAAAALDGNLSVHEHGALPTQLSPYRLARHAFVVRRGAA